MRHSMEVCSGTKSTGDAFVPSVPRKTTFTTDATVGMFDESSKIFSVCLLTPPPSCGPVVQYILYSGTKSITPPAEKHRQEMRNAANLFISSFDPVTSGSWS